MTDIQSGKKEFYLEDSGEVIPRIQFVPSGKDIKQFLQIKERITSNNNVTVYIQ